MDDLREALGPIFVAFGLLIVAGSVVMLVASGLSWIFTRPALTPQGAYLIAAAFGVLLIGAGIALIPRLP